MKHVIFLPNDDFTGICLEGQRASDPSHRLCMHMPNTQPASCLLEDQVTPLFQSSLCSRPQSTARRLDPDCADRTVSPW